METLQNTLFTKNSVLDITTPLLSKLKAFLDQQEDDKEVWKAIIGYNGYYYISNYGRVLSLKGKQAQILKPQDTGKGYYYVDLEGQQRKIHRLVALAFLPNPYHKPVVHHKDGNKHNNNLSNLQYATYKENAVYYHQERKSKQLKDNA